MKKNNLPNPTLHEIRSANPQKTRMQLPIKPQSYVKTIERMAGVGYNRNRDVKTLLNMQTKGQQIGGRVNPETDYSRFGDLPNGKMAIQQNKYLKPTNDQSKEMLRRGNTNRRVIAKGTYVNGIAGKGFEGENLVVPKRGRPYKGQPNSLPLVTKSKKINKHETGQPHTHSSNDDVDWGNIPLDPLYRLMMLNFQDPLGFYPSTNMMQNLVISQLPQNPNEIIYNPNVQRFGRYVQDITGLGKKTQEPSTTPNSQLNQFPQRFEEYKRNYPNMYWGFPMGIATPYGAEKIMERVGQKIPFKTIQNLNRISKETPLGWIETPLMINNAIDAANAMEKESEYNTGGYMPRGVIPQNASAAQVPEVDINTLRRGDETLNPLSIKDSDAFGFIDADKNKFLDTWKKTYIPVVSEFIPPYQALQLALSTFAGLPQLASTLAMGTLNKPKFKGEIETSPLTLIDNLLNDQNNPMHTGIRQGKAKQKDLDKLVYGNINPEQYAQLRNELNFTNFNELPESLKQEYGRFAFPEQRRMKPTYNIMFQDIMDSMFGGNTYLPVGNVDNSPYAKFRNTFGARGQTNAMAEGILSQVKGWNKHGQMQDLLAYNQPMNEKNEFTSFPLKGNKKWEMQNYFFPGYPSEPNMLGVDFSPMFRESGYEDVSPISPNSTTMFDLFPSKIPANKINEMLQNEALNNQFMVGAQMSNVPQNEYANFIPDKRWGEKLQNAMDASSQRMARNFGKSLNPKYTTKNETIQKSMNSKPTNKYFVEKGKKK